MYTIIRKTFCGEEDICADMYSQYDYFTSKDVAELIAKDLTINMNSEAWYGFKWYGSKFYAKEVSEEYIATICRRNANIQTAQMMM